MLRKEYNGMELIKLESDYPESEGYLVVLDKDILFVKIYTEDIYRSKTSKYILKESLEDFLEDEEVECKTFYKTDKKVEVVSVKRSEGKSDSCDETSFLVDGEEVFSFGTFYFDEYYYNGFIKVNQSSVKEEFYELLDLVRSLTFSGEVVDKITNTQNSFILTGRPRIGKTTFSQRYKGKVVDTDGFKNPLDVVDNINGNTCYVIGKWRNVEVTLGSEEGARVVTYKDFINELLTSQEVEVISLSLEDRICCHGEGIFLDETNSELLSGFDLDNKDGLRNIVIGNVSGYTAMFDRDQLTFLNLQVEKQPLK